MPPARAEFSSRAARLLWPAAVLALAPKCVLCVPAYAGLGAAIGLGGPEMCGGAPDSPITWPTTFAWFGVVMGLGALCAFAHRRHE